MGMYGTATQSLDLLERRVEALSTANRHAHDRYVVVTLHEAIAAAREGNFAVGACLVDADGNIVQRGHNHVFHPYPRSDLHAEMDTLTRFEESRTGITSLRDFTLFTSLEPCPMCLTRLITAGVGKVYYAAPDPEGGMVCRLSQLTPVWVELAARQTFAEADISAEMQTIAHEIFLVTANSSTARLEAR